MHSRGCLRPEEAPHGHQISEMLENSSQGMSACLPSRPYSAGVYPPRCQFAILDMGRSVSTTASSPCPSVRDRRGVGREAAHPALRAHPAEIADSRTGRREEPNAGQTAHSVPSHDGEPCRRPLPASDAQRCRIGKIARVGHCRYLALVNWIKFS